MKIWEDEIAQACEFIEEQDEDPSNFRFLVTLEDGLEDQTTVASPRYSVKVVCGSKAPIMYASTASPGWVRLFERDLSAGLYG